MRIIDSGTRTQILARQKDVVYFVEAAFRTALVRLCTCASPLTWKGQVWTGLGGSQGGAVLSMEAAEETGKVEATGFKFVLTGLDPTLLTYCLGELSIAKQCRVWLGFLDATGLALAGEPIEIFEGWMDAADIEASGGGATITLQVESELRRLQMASGRKWTNADQQIDFPGDRGLELMSQAATWKARWGALEVGGTGVSTHGGGTTGGVPKWKEDEE